MGLMMGKVIVLPTKSTAEATCKGEEGLRFKLKNMEAILYWTYLRRQRIGRSSAKSLGEFWWVEVVELGIKQALQQRDFCLHSDEVSIRTGGEGDIICLQPSFNNLLSTWKWN